MNQRLTFAALAAAAGMLLSSATGCELIASVDRSLIAGTGGAGTGGTGGTSTGGTGGTGGTNTGGTNTGGTNTGGTGPTCGAGVMTCTAPGDCPDPGNECVQNTCDMGCCGTTNVPDNTATTTGQTDKDCKQVVCDGTGNTKIINDDADLPDAADECHAPSCAAGVPTQTPTTMGSVCSVGGNVCDGNGTCVECLVDNDCTGGLVCDPVNGSHTCVPADCADNQLNGDETDVDCGGSCGATCGTGEMCMDGNDCVSKVCTGGTCAQEDCADGVKNGTETGLDCGGPVCGAGGLGLLCSFGEGCGGPADCDTGACNGVTCVYKPQGASCNNHGECGAAGTNLCVDGVCCNTSCTNGCMACSAAKKGGGGDGTCGNVAIGNDPNNFCTDAGAASCGNNGVCDGAGACQKYAAGTICRAAVPGGCDVAESCPGSGAACPTDQFVAAGTVCRAAVPGGCDVAESCNGTSATCPTDQFMPNGTVCRMATGQCDIAESCNGTSATCPIDQLVAAGAPIGTQTPGDCQVIVCAGLDGTTTSSVNSTSDIPTSSTVCLINPHCAVSGGIATPAFDPAPTGTDCSVEGPPGQVCGDTSGAAAGTCVECNTGADCAAASCVGATLTPAETCSNNACMAATPAARAGNLQCADATSCHASCGSADAAGDAKCVSGFYCDGSTCQAQLASGLSCTRDGECTSGSCLPGADAGVTCQ